MTARIKTTDDGDVDRYIKESCRSFKECNVKNTARRNSLFKKTLGIESERRIASTKLFREERELREQLKQMNIEKAKNHIVHDLREKKHKKTKKKIQNPENHVLPIEPYPVTFRSHTPSPVNVEKQMEMAGHLYAISGRRRQSKEYEDLCIDTESGTLYRENEYTADEAGPRRRVYSMSYVQKILSGKQFSHSGRSSGHNSPRTSPDLRRKLLTRSKGGHSSSSSKECLNDSTERLASLGELDWVGNPVAIHSVRRARKTAEELEFETEIHKLRLT